MENTILKSNEAAIVFSEEGLKLVMPNQEETDMVPDYIKTCAGLAMLLCNPDTNPIVMDMIIKLYENSMDKNLAEEDEGEVH
jgi:hypothetical protein